MIAATAHHSLASTQHIRSLLKPEVYRVRSTIYHGLKRLIDLSRKEGAMNAQRLSEFGDLIKVDYHGDESLCTKVTRQIIDDEKIDRKVISKFKEVQFTEAPFERVSRSHR